MFQSQTYFHQEVLCNGACHLHLRNLQVQRGLSIVAVLLHCTPLLGQPTSLWNHQGIWEKVAALSSPSWHNVCNKPEWKRKTAFQKLTLILTHFPNYLPLFEELYIQNSPVWHQGFQPFTEQASWESSDQFVSSCWDPVLWIKLYCILQLCGGKASPDCQGFMTWRKTQEKRWKWTMSCTQRRPWDPEWQEIFLWHWSASHFQHQKPKEYSFHNSKFIDT